MSRVNNDEMCAAGFSDPLPCETCKNCLDPIGGFSRARNCFCAAYSSSDNMKPDGVLFDNEDCPNYEEEVNGDE